MSVPSPPEYAAQLDLRFVVPLQRGQRVLIIGNYPVFARELAHFAEITTTANWRDQQGQVFDHVFLIYPNAEHLTHLVSIQQTLLVSQGWLCIAGQNAYALQRLRFWKPRRNRGMAFSHHSLRLEPCMAFGVYPHLDNPRFFIDLSNHHLAQFFVDSFVPLNSRSGPIAKKLLPILVSLRLHHILFTDMIVTSRKI